MYEVEKHLDAIAREIDDLRKVSCKCSGEETGTSVSSAEWHLFSIAREIMTMRFMIDRLYRENTQLKESMKMLPHQMHVSHT